MNKIEFEQIKNNYLNTRPPERLVSGGWLEVVGKLSEGQRRSIPLFFRLVLACLVIMILVGGGLLGISQAAVPGDALYLVKRLAEDMTYAVTGDEIKKVDARAWEVLKVAGSGDDGTKLEKAAQEYQQAVNESKEETASEKKEEIRNELRRHGDRFEEIKKSKPGISEKLDIAINAAREGAEVKGVGDSRDEEEDGERNDGDNGGNGNNGGKKGNSRENSDDERD